MFGVLYALMGLVVFVPVVGLMSMAGADSGMAGFGMGFLILLPVIYGVLGFIFIAIACLLYNLVAGWVGGIEMELGPE